MNFKLNKKKIFLSKVAIRGDAFLKKIQIYIDLKNITFSVSNTSSNVTGAYILEVRNQMKAHFFKSAFELKDFELIMTSHEPLLCLCQDSS